MGFIGYYRRFFKDFATLARPLNRLTSRDVPFEWKEDEEKAFQALRSLMIQAPVLAYPQPGIEYILDTDASADGAGAVLSQYLEGEE